MLFLVDGYNVTMADPATRDLDKEHQRDALVRRLAASSKARLGTGAVVVVFDARSMLGASSDTIAGVRVVFAPDADAEIVRRAAAARGQVTVVTNDRRLAARISQDVGRHVVYRDASVLFEGSEAPRGRLRGAIAHADDGGRPPRADEITRELEQLWLRGDEDEESC